MLISQTVHLIDFFNIVYFSSGIGFEAAKDLAKRGARIIMVCRNIEKAKHAKEEIILASGNSKIFVGYLLLFFLNILFIIYKLRIISTCR